MKHVFKIIGVIVVVALLAGLVLYFLNGQGYIRGPLADWINRMTGHLTGVVQDSEDLYHEFRGDTVTPSPIPQTTEPTATPAPEAVPLG